MKRRSHTAVPLSHHVESFLEMLVAERGLSENTLDAYSRDLSGFEVGAHRPYESHLHDENQARKDMGGIH